MKSIFYILFACTMLFPAMNYAAENKPLPAETAFQFSAEIKQANEILLHWKIAPGYYLYENKFHFTTTPNVKTTAQFPAVEWKTDATHHRPYAVFSGNITVPLLLQTNEQSLRLNVNYQGCSQGGFCYPPMHKELMLNLSSREISATSQHTTEHMQTLLTSQNSISQFLQASSLSVVLLMFVGLGLLLAFTPCILPVIPILTSVIVGQKHPLSTKKALLLTSTYIIGMSLAYALAGLLAAMMGHSLQVWLQNRWVISAVSLLFVLLALSLFGTYYLRLPRRLHNALAHWSHQQQGGTYTGAFSMGLISTLIVSPCVTAPLVGVLIYIAESGNQLFGASALFAMGIGMGLPLLLVGVSAGKWLPKSGPWMEAIKKSFGFVMIAMAIWLLARITPAWVITILWSLLLFGVAFFLAAYLPLLIKRQLILRGMGIASACVGVALMLSLLPVWQQNETLRSPNHSVVIVHTIADANVRIAAAKAENLPVLLDFYADWCESCVSMDKKVFNQPNIEKALTGFVVLRADLSANNQNDEALLNHFNVVAPPTILFFSTDGHEVNAKRIVGEVSATEFLSRITTFYAEGCDKKAQC